MKKRIVSMLLVLVMVVSVTSIIVPASAREGLPSISKSCYIRAYTIKSTGKAYPYMDKTSKVKDTSHWIDRAKDECKIIAISGNRVKVIYPTSSGPSEPRWFDASEFFSGGHTNAEYVYWRFGPKVNTYRRKDMKVQYGYVGGNYNSADGVWVIDTVSGSCLQILYTVDAQYGGGYKLAWGDNRVAW